MVKEFATLLAADSEEPVGVYRQSIQVNGQAHVTVRLHEPYLLKPQAALAIYASGNAVPIIQHVAGQADESIKFFEGASKEAVKIHQSISLVHSPGGLLSNLLVVVAKGSLQQDVER